MLTTELVSPWPCIWTCTKSRHAPPSCKPHDAGSAGNPHCIQESVMKSKLLILALTVIVALGSAAAQARDLFAAARSNDVNLAKSLLDAKVDVNQPDDKGYTPLIVATYND